MKTMPSPEFLKGLILTATLLLEGNSAPTEKPLVVLITSYNNIEWYKRNLSSILRQNYSNYRVIYIDDASPDGTGQAVANYVQKNDPLKRVTVLRNKTRQRKLKNIYKAVHTLNDNDIIVQIDGDDWLAHNNVLDCINRAYTTGDPWISYGTSIRYHGKKKGYGKKVPSKAVTDVTNRRSFLTRDWAILPVRTFYAWLFKKIKKCDLLTKDVAGFKGDFYPCTDDIAFMQPMLEMAGSGHIKFIDEVLYEINLTNTASEYHSQRKLQLSCRREILERVPYVPLKNTTIPSPCCKGK